MGVLVTVAWGLVMLPRPPEPPMADADDTPVPDGGLVCRSETAPRSEQLVSHRFKVRSM